MAKKQVYNIKLEFPRRGANTNIDRRDPEYGLKALFPKKRKSTKRQTKIEQRKYTRNQKRAYRKKYPIKRYQ